MSNAVKWALLAAAFLAVIVVIMTFPFVQYISPSIAEIGTYVEPFVKIVGKYTTTARGLINIFLLPYARGLLSGCFMYLIFKKIMTMTVKITAWIYHFIFK